jgi:hypothetical protein
MQGPCDLPRHAGKSSGISDIAVSCDLPFRNATNGGEEFLEVLCFRIGVGIQSGEILNDSISAYRD